LPPINTIADAREALVLIMKRLAAGELETKVANALTYGILTFCRISAAAERER
jgi:hypothetical protein